MKNLSKASTWPRKTWIELLAFASPWKMPVCTIYCRGVSCQEPSPCKKCWLRCEKSNSPRNRTRPRWELRFSRWTLSAKFSSYRRKSNASKMTALSSWRRWPQTWPPTCRSLWCTAWTLSTSTWTIWGRGSRMRHPRTSAIGLMLRHARLVTGLGKPQSVKSDTWVRAAKQHKKTRRARMKTTELRTDGLSEWVQWLKLASSK